MGLFGVDAAVGTPAFGDAVAVFSLRPAMVDRRGCCGGVWLRLSRTARQGVIRARNCGGSQSEA